MSIGWSKILKICQVLGKKRFSETFFFLQEMRRMIKDFVEKWWNKKSKGKLYTCLYYTRDIMYAINLKKEKNK